MQGLVLRLRRLPSCRTSLPLGISVGAEGVGSSPGTRSVRQAQEIGRWHTTLDLPNKPLQSSGFLFYLRQGLTWPRLHVDA